MNAMYGKYLELCSARLREKYGFSVERIASRHGVEMLRIKFHSFEELEAFFAFELVGSPLMKGSASKVIGTALLIWDR